MTARSKGKWVQFELKLATGSEAWVIVRYRGGAFRLPITADVLDLLNGVAQGWDMHSRAPLHGEGTVRVPLGEYMRRWKAPGGSE